MSEIEDKKTYYGEVVWFDPKGDSVSSSGQLMGSNKKICSCISLIFPAKDSRQCSSTKRYLSDSAPTCVETQRPPKLLY